MDIPREVGLFLAILSLMVVSDFNLIPVWPLGIHCVAVYIPHLQIGKIVKGCHRNVFHRNIALQD